MKTKRLLAEAEVEAQSIMAQLAPDITRGLVVGSTRRKKPEVGDIEVAVEPLYEKSGLFGEKVPAVWKIEDVLKTLSTIGKNGDRYKQVKLTNGYQLDVFIIHAPAQWGYRIAILTGDEDFSHKCVTKSTEYGFLPPYLKCDGGAVWHGKELISTPTEDDFLDLLGLRGLPPEQRNVDDARRWIQEHKAKA